MVHRIRTRLHRTFNTIGRTTDTIFCPTTNRQVSIANMFTISVRWSVSRGKPLYKTFESHEGTSQKAIKDVTDQLFESLSYTPDALSFEFQPEPSPQFQKLRGCTCKKNYFTEGAAQTDADAINKTRAKHLPKEAAYKCQFCKFWHVGASKWRPATT